MFKVPKVYVPHRRKSFDPADSVDIGSFFFSFQHLHKGFEPFLWSGRARKGAGVWAAFRWGCGKSCSERGAEIAMSAARAATIVGVVFRSLDLPWLSPSVATRVNVRVRLCEEREPSTAADNHPSMDPAPLDVPLRFT
ncbi:hypothetical protein BDK51DRAFT_49869 [Blyttiomyces helicus]|uniref:Uncharacterized protein n=1 Tax=Blyttiomyces helicus TaxID=388810 RepID=A0A4P9VWJ5_9FUNG|nr:hypothetical protein BDK51DRAFT_49869 [Blyttiomyces helicus]|eukprot:RKO83542.1 hypothetical protein BDK51DRAFT_49869 [Blyttiomyces helicus]